MNKILLAEIAVDPSTLQSVLHLRVRASGRSWNTVRFGTEALADLASRPELSDRERFTQRLQGDYDPLLERVIKTGKAAGMNWNQPHDPARFQKFRTLIMQETA